MLTQEEDVEIHALRKQGWTISAIARHTGRDRKTIRRPSAPYGSPRLSARFAMSRLRRRVQCPGSQRELIDRLG